MRHGPVWLCVKCRETLAQFPALPLARSSPVAWELHARMGPLFMQRGLTALQQQQRQQHRATASLMRICCDVIVGHPVVMWRAVYSIDAVHEVLWRHMLYAHCASVRRAAPSKNHRTNAKEKLVGRMGRRYTDLCTRQGCLLLLQHNPVLECSHKDCSVHREGRPTVAASCATSDVAWDHHSDRSKHPTGELTPDR